MLGPVIERRRITIMRHNPRARAAATALVTALTLAAGPAAGADLQDATDRHRHDRSSAAAVLHWSAIAEATVADGQGPGPAQVQMATVAVAVHDAVVALERGSRPYVSKPEVRWPASLSAAVATAAHHVLVARVPDHATEVGREYRAYLRRLPSTRSTLNGIDVGTQVADAVIERRAGDGLGDPVPYVQPTPGPGVFEPVAPATPIGLDLARVTPFAMSSPDQFRPDGPPPLDGADYARDFAEVRDFGRADSAVRTDEQTEIARFWSDHGFLQWSRTLRDIVAERRLDARDAARVQAMVHVAGADGAIGCFDAKYHHLFWRPSHAVPRADTDGNDATDPDATWTPLLNSNHPEYPSGAACVNAAITSVLAEFFGTDRVAFAMSSAVTGTTRHYSRFSASLDEDVDARVWSGLHFRGSMLDGVELGRSVADLVSGTLFQPVRRAG
jgi:hypothetical protein